MNSESLSALDVGSGTPVLMLHGYTIDHRLLLPLEQVFAERQGWRRVYVDLPGHGHSPRLEGVTTADAIADRVIDFARDTFGSQPFAVVGISFGGQLARAVAASFGEQVLGTALLAPVVRWGEDVTLPDDHVVRRDEALLRSLPPEERTAFEWVTANQTTEQWEAFERSVLPGLRVHDKAAAAELADSFLLTSAPESTSSGHQGHHLVVTGRQDGLVGWRDQLTLLDHYPRMTFAALDAAGHNVHLEQPAATFALLGDWLDSMRA